MSRRRLHGALVLAIVLMLAAPATAASPGGSAADACRSSERDRFVIRRPPLPPDSDPSTLPVTCLAQHVVQALREGKPVDLEHVVLKGTLDLGAAAARTLQIDLPLRRDTQRQLLDKWFDERRRDHRAADTLTDQAAFRVIGVPISIRQSWIESIDGGGGDPLFLLVSATTPVRGRTVVYRLHQTAPDGPWRVYDLETNGRSRIRAYYTEFDRIILSEGYRVLLSRLQAELDIEAPGEGRRECGAVAARGR